MKLRLFPIVMVCLSISVQAELRLASVITDHAVLQRDSPIHVWGEASPAEQVTITFHAQSVATTANQPGPVGCLAQAGTGGRSLHSYRPRQLGVDPF